MIYNKAKSMPHAETINALAADGTISPVEITIHYPGGVQLMGFNSAWAATEWLSQNGIYDRKLQVDWDLNPPKEG